MLAICCFESEETFINAIILIIIAENGQAVIDSRGTATFYE